MALRSLRLLFIGLLAGVLGACTGSGSPGATPPTAIPSTVPSWTTATCPPGSNPDAAGPAGQARPLFGDASPGSVAFDRQSGRVVHVDFGGQTWTFDVCANTWQQVSTRGMAPQGGTDLFYDPVDDLTYAVSTGTIRYYDVETSVWTTVAEPGGVLHVPGPPFVMDPVKEVIYGYDVGQQLRAYDIASNTWTEVEQGERRPPSDWGEAAVAFDPASGRIVLSGLRPNEPAIAPPVERARSNTIAETWTFDPGTGTWRRVSTRNSTLALYGHSISGVTYHENTGTPVLVTDDGVAAYDATANRWSVPRPGTGCPDLTRLGHGVVDDVVNGRVLVLGGNVRTPEGASQNGTDVWAYDVGANAWTELVPPQPD